MPIMINNLLGQHVEEVRKSYSERLKPVILYGYYVCPGDFRPDLDIDILKWLGVYPFCTNVQKEGVELYGTA